MRRSVLLILATVVLICTGLFIYPSLQPPVPKKPKGSLGTINNPRPQLSQAMRGLGDGEHPWVKRYDAKTGELASQFKSRTDKPKKDGTVDVDDPEAEFFSNDGKQRIRINGVTGNVVMKLGPEDKSNSNNAFQSQGAAMPSRGKLHDVIISVFEPVDAVEPMLTATMNNAAFDADTFRVNTEAFTNEHGDNVPADQVPVKVRGRDYDFDGRGLIVLWNERDRKLQLLEVAHGESLVIKNPSALSAPGMSPSSASSPPSTPSSTQATTQPAARAVVPFAVTDGMLASADPTAHRLILAAAKPKPGPKPATKPPPSAAARRRRPATTTAPAPTTKPKNIRDLSPVVYRANFEQDVRIFQGDDLVATADHMHVDWLQQPEKSSATQPAADTKGSGANGSPNSALPPTSQPSTHPTGSSRRHSTTSAPTSQSAGNAPATTQPTQKPVTVKWTGKLRVVPLDNAPVSTMIPGKAIVHLIGAPATLIQNTMRAYCGQAIFNSADNSAALLPSKKVPQVTMTGERGMKVVTPQVQYAEPSVGPHTATLIGPSTADLPVEGDDPTQHAMMNTSWSKTCVLKMVGAADHAVLQEADLDGDVKVAHPKMRMTSDALVLGFDPAPPTTRPAKPQATQPATQATTVATTAPATQSATRPATKPSDTVSASLREILATGNAHCTMIDEQNPREMDADRLHVTLGRSNEGQMYPAIVDCDGNVHTEETSYTIENDETIESVRTMDAGHMTARLAPSTRPATTRPTTQIVAATDPTTSPTTLATTQKTRSTSQPFGGANLKLVSLLATDNVRLTAPDETIATAETLHAETVDDQLRYTLIGNPDATISSNKSGNSKTIIVGPRIVFDPDRNIAQVIGGGRALGADPDKPLQAMHMEWTGDADIDGNTNLIDVDRNVVIHSIEADGTANKATAHHLQAILTTKPTTQAAGATQPGAAQNAKPQAAGDLQTTSFLKDKEISTGILTGEVNIKSELHDKDGSLARGMLLEAEKVTFDQLAGRMEVPVPGSLLYQDHRNPATEPTTNPSTTQSTTQSATLSTTQSATKPATTQSSHRKSSTKSTTGPSESRGATAFSWQNSLIYERALQKATMTGDVTVIHNPDNEAGMPFKLNGQTLIAIFDPKEATTRPAEKPATKSASTDPGEQMGKLKQITVIGDVQVRSTRLDVDADDLTFNPITQILTAHGDPNHPVTVFDHKTGTTQTTTDLFWNMATDTTRMKNATGRITN